MMMLPSEDDEVELLADLKEIYGLSKGDKGKVLLRYDKVNEDDEYDFEVFFENIDMSVILLESQIKLVE